MAVAGSQTAKDWWDDVSKVPFCSDLRKSDRFGQLNNALQKHPETKQLLGHSLGGSVILEKQQYYPNLSTTTYNAPVLQLSSMPQGQRYRSNFDTVSMFDKGPKSIGDGSLFNHKQSHSHSGNSKDTYASNTILPNNTQI